MALPNVSAPGRRVVGWVAAATCLVLGVLGGAWFHSTLPRTYATSTSVLVLPTVAGLESSISGGRTTGTVEIDTEVELARSTAVARAASQTLGGRMSQQQLQAGTSVTVPTNSTVLVVEVEAPQALLARDAAAAVARAYLEQRQTAADQEVLDVTTSLQAQVTDLTTRLQESATAIGRLEDDDTAGRALLESQRTLLVSQLADVNSRLVALQSGSTPGGQVITAAAVPSKPVAPILWVNVGAGALVGALVGGALLQLLEQRGRLRAAALRRGALTRDLGRLVVPRPGTEGAASAAQLTQLVGKVDGYRAGRAGPEVVVAVGPSDLVRDLVIQLNSTWVRDRGGNVLVVAQRGVLDTLTGAGRPGLADVLRGERSVKEVLRGSASTGGQLLGPGTGTAQLAPAALRVRLAKLWVSMTRGEEGTLVVLVPPLDSVEAQSVLRTAGRILVAVAPGTMDDEAVSGLYEDFDFLGLSEIVVGTVEVSARADEDGRGATPAAVRARGRDAGETVRGTIGAGSDGSRRPDTRTDGGERTRAPRADDARTDTDTDTGTDDDATRPGADAASAAARGTR